MGEQLWCRPDTPDGAKLRVFMSYSRNDVAFAEQLASALNLYGFECLIDHHSISGGEEWKQRLGNLISEADTIIFVLSPDSAGSEICAWEVEEAVRLNKRIIPINCRPLEGTNPPSRLRDLNYILFHLDPKTPGSGFGTGLASLVTALAAQVEREKALHQAEEALKQAADAQRKRARFKIALVVVSVLAVVAVLLGWGADQKRIAEQYLEQKETAERYRINAEQQKQQKDTALSRATKIVAQDKDDPAKVREFLEWAAKDSVEAKTALRSLDEEPAKVPGHDAPVDPKDDGKLARPTEKLMKGTTPRRANCPEMPPLKATRTPDLSPYPRPPAAPSGGGGGAIWRSKLRFRRQRAARPLRCVGNRESLRLQLNFLPSAMARLHCGRSAPSGYRLANMAR